MLSCQNISNNQKQDEYNAIDKTIDSFMIARNIPGFSIALVSDTKLVWSKSYGKSEVKKNRHQYGPDYEYWLCIKNNYGCCYYAAMGKGINPLRFRH